MTKTLREDDPANGTFSALLVEAMGDMSVRDLARKIAGHGASTGDIESRRRQIQKWLEDEGPVPGPRSVRLLGEFVQIDEIKVAEIRARRSRRQSNASRIDLVEKRVGRLETLVEELLRRGSDAASSQEQ